MLQKRIIIEHNKITQYNCGAFLDYYNYNSDIEEIYPNKYGRIISQDEVTKKYLQETIIDEIENQLNENKKQYLENIILCKTQQNANFIFAIIISIEENNKISFNEKIIKSIMRNVLINCYEQCIDKLVIDVESMKYLFTTHWGTYNNNNAIEIIMKEIKTFIQQKSMFYSNWNGEIIFNCSINDKPSLEIMKNRIFNEVIPNIQLNENQSENLRRIRSTIDEIENYQEWTQKQQLEEIIVNNEKEKEKGKEQMDITEEVINEFDEIFQHIKILDKSLDLYEKVIKSNN